ncbi:EAL domain-containing protein [Rahnella selenatireducens]|uniref:EAL domain-containing protein n=1 Tax=Rahnella selenatireducens TaxID=3389797 RepID=UPI003968B217
MLIIRDEIDRVLTHARIASHSATHFLEGKCNAATQTDIRKIVATVPDVRTVSLLKGSHIYCSSVFGQQNLILDALSTPPVGLSLMNGNALTPYRSLLIYRMEHADKSVMVGIDGYYLQNKLKTTDKRMDYQMTVSGLTLNADGQVLSHASNNASIRYNSPDFHYQISAYPVYSPGIKTLIEDEKSGIFLTFLLSSVLCAWSDKRFSRRNTLLFGLKKALDKKELIPVIQPIIEAHSGNTVGGEVLMRWNHSALGNIPPERFIPLAEKNGLISRITQSALQSVADGIALGKYRLPREMTLFFNVSAADFMSDDILESCRLFMQKTQIADLHLGLEITEREPVEDTRGVQELCQQLAALGVNISVDDFGTGNSNYRYLMQFRPRYIKIDKVFTSGIETDAKKEAIVRNIIAIAQDMRCMTIAEGIETASQKEKLAAMGITHFQGYYFSKPVEMAAFFRNTLILLP